MNKCKLTRHPKEPSDSRSNLRKERKGEGVLERLTEFPKYLP